MAIPQRKEVGTGVYTHGVSCAGEIEVVETVQEVDAVPVLAGEPRGRAMVRSLAPGGQAAALAAGGFLAGAAVVGLAARRRDRPARGAARRRRRGRGRAATRRRRGAGELVKIVGTRSLLVDVHLLDSAGR